MSSSMSLGKKILIFVTLIVYIIHLVFNGLANSNDTLFPNTTSEVSKAFTLPITPAGATFSIWGVIFTLQLAWLVYCVTTVFRKGEATDILSAKYYIFFIINILFIVTWLLLWARMEVTASFVIIVLSQIFLDATLITASIDLYNYLTSHSVTGSDRADIWCIRILVQNGLIFYATWTTIATMINTAVVIGYEISSNTKTASLIVLSILFVLILVWFVLENFVVEKYVRFVCAEYIVLIVASIGILAKNWDDHETTSRFVLAILIFSILFFIARIILIAVKEKRRSSDGEMYGAIQA